jgi:hypothetical protein
LLLLLDDMAAFPAPRADPFLRQRSLQQRHSVQFR